MAPRRLALVAVATLAASACDGGGSADAGPPAVSEGEAQALDEAAKMLDAKRLPEGALPQVNPPAPPKNDPEETR